VPLFRRRSFEPTGGELKLKGAVKRILGTLGPLEAWVLPALRSAKGVLAGRLRDESVARDLLAYLANRRAQAGEAVLDFFLADWCTDDITSLTRRLAATGIRVGLEKNIAGDQRLRTAKSATQSRLLDANDEIVAPFK
jgi:hypothetical protein